MPVFEYMVRCQGYKKLHTMQSFQLIELLDDTVESRGLDTVKNFAELLVN